MLEPINFKQYFNSFSYKDAVFLSPHKFVGGPGTPGMASDFISYK